MLLKTSKPWLILGVILGIYSLSWLLQNTLLLNYDVSWLMLAAKRLLAGGNYTHDFFEVNPPIILYLYTPAVILTKIFPLPSNIALRIYIYLLASLSLFCCWRLSQNEITLHHSHGMRKIIIVTLAIIFLFVPLSEFGQREHLLLIFSMPYLFLIANRLQQTTQGTAIFYFLIGCMAGIGFVIKPYFFTSLLFLEIYLMRYRRTWLAWLRPEIFGMFVIFLLALDIVFLINQDYVTDVLPRIVQLYYQKYGLSLSTIIKNPQAVFAYYTILIYCILSKNKAYQSLRTVFVISIVGFLISAFMQQTIWYYHTLPFFSLSLLLCVMQFGLWVNTTTLGHEKFLIGLLTTCILAYLFWQLNYITLSIFLYPLAYFSLFAFVFGFLFYIAYTRKIKAAMAFSFTLLAGVLFQAYLLHSPLQIHSFLLTTTLLILLFILLLPEKNRATNTVIKYQFTYFAIVGIVIFAYPVYEIAYVYNYSSAYKKLYANLITTLGNYPNKSIYFFSNTADLAFPAIDYTHQQYASRFGCLGWLPPISYRDTDAIYANAYQHNQALMDFFIPALTEDINRHQPDLIFVDMRNTNIDQQKRYFGNGQIDYLRFFLQNKSFKTTWANYHYLKTVDGQPLFKFMIYERNRTVTE